MDPTQMTAVNNDRACPKAAQRAKSGEPGEPGKVYEPHWLESTDAMVTSGALTFLMEIIQTELHGFAQYHMLACVCKSFQRQLAVLATEWSKRRQPCKPMSPRKPFDNPCKPSVSKWLDPLPIAQRATGKAFSTGLNTEYPDSAHPQQSLLRIGSVVTHLTLNLEHLTNERDASKHGYDLAKKLKDDEKEELGRVVEQVSAKVAGKYVDAKELQQTVCEAKDAAEKLREAGLPAEAAKMDDMVGNLGHALQAKLKAEEHPCFLSKEFVQMMNELPEDLANDLRQWASRRNVTKKLLVYHVQRVSDRRACDELHRSIIFFCPLVRLETMQHPRFQMMFPTSAFAIDRLVVPNDWALADYSVLKQELCTWFTDRNLVSVVQFCREIKHEMITNSDCRHYLSNYSALDNPKKYSSCFWFTDMREFLWDCTACLNVFSYPAFMRVTDTCMLDETKERVRKELFDDETPSTKWVLGASLFPDSVSFLPEIILQVQTNLYALMALTGNFRLDMDQLTNTPIPDVDITLDFGAIFPVCNACQQAAEPDQANPQDRPKTNCCLRQMYYANYSQDNCNEEGFQRYDADQVKQKVYTNKKCTRRVQMNYRPCQSFSIDENGLWVLEDFDFF